MVAILERGTMKKVIKNRWKCLCCREILESNYAHDFITCSCGSLSIDGGPYIPRVLFKDENMIEDLSTYDEE